MVLADNQAIAAASTEERRALYEQWSILGTLLAATRLGLDQQPDPSLSDSIRAAGKDYLEDSSRSRSTRCPSALTGW
ncbi:MAG: hypothetical protein HC871_11345 [Rhizobiales bacterium]|nr:hypothetical protein [Hyphomicrobiales bacterium]